MYDLAALYEARSPEEACQLRLAHPDAVLIAGGSDVLIKIREGKLAGKELISLYGLDELRGVRLLADATLHIGSLSSFSHIAADPLIQELLPVLGEAVSLVGGPQVRNIGTIGGNTCNGVTSADSASTLCAYDAEVELLGSEGSRLLPLRNFYLGAGKVDLRPDEIQVAIRIPPSSYQGYFGHYIKYAMRGAMDIATLGCSVNVRLDPSKQILEDVRIAYGVAGPVPCRASGAEAAGRGQALSENTLRLLSKRCTEDVNPRDSWRASKDFRLHLVETCAYRALREAVLRAGASLDAAL